MACRWRIGPGSGQRRETGCGGAAACAESGYCKCQSERKVPHWKSANLTAFIRTYPPGIAIRHPLLGQGCRSLSRKSFMARRTSASLEAENIVIGVWQTDHLS